MSSRCNVEPHDKKGNVFHRKLFPFTFNEKLHRSFKGQRAKWKFACYILTTVNMGKNITIHSKISPGAPSVRALESNWIYFSGERTASQNYCNPMISVPFSFNFKSLLVSLLENTKFDLEIWPLSQCERPQIKMDIRRNKRYLVKL